MADDEQSFGQQAAKASLCTPFIVLCVHLLGGNAMVNQRRMLYAVPIINITLIVAGLVLGIVALRSMKRFGTRRILGRAIGGLVLNGTVLASLALLLPAIFNDADLRRRLVQHWHLSHSTTAANTAPANIALGADGNFRIDESSPTAGPLVILGNWRMNRIHEIHISMVSVNSKPVGSPPQEMTLGSVSFVTDNHLGLKSGSGSKEYSCTP